MKRIVAITLSLILLLGCGTVAVSADSEENLPAALVVTLTRSGYPQNITMSLKGYDVEPLYLMNPGDVLAMYYVQFKDEMSDEAVDQAVAALKSNPVFIKEVTPYYSGMELPVSLSREFPFNPPKAKTRPVNEIGWYLPDASDDQVAELIVDAANALYRTRMPFPSEDIVMEYSYQFKDSSLYAVRFVVKDYEYVSIEFADNIGDWLLYSGYLPEPYIFADNKLYTVKGAYDGGVLTQAQMEELSQAARHTGFYLTRSIKGDADGDGACNIIDATVIQRYGANIIPETGLCKPLADVDGDNNVGIIDATLIQRCEAGMYTIE